MTVVGLHPEELFDKLLDGEINSAERERLRLHMEACDVCRFEYAARLDFHTEALSSALEGPPPLSPMRAPIPASVAAAAPMRRRRSRRVVWGLAAAALITASGALASVVSGAAPWRAMSLVFSQAATLASQPAPAAKSAPRTHGGCKGADCVAVSKPAAQTEAASSAFVAPVPAPRARAASAAVSARAGSASGAVGQVARVSATATRAEAPVSALPPVVKEPGTESVEAQAAAKEPTTSAKLFAEANQARRAGDIGRASGLYHLLQEQFPGSAEAELSRVTLALLLLDSGDAQGALSGFERYLAGASRGLEAEALVGRARALGRLGRRDLEAKAWQEVQRKYPRSIYGRQATERLSALGLP
jgi:TolA-binding protein